MTFRSDLFEYLDADTGLTTVVASKIYPHLAPTDVALPYITYQQIANPSEHHTAAAAAIARPTIQFDCWANSDVELESVTEALRNALDGFQHTNIGSGPTDVKAVFVESQFDDIEEPSDGSEKAVFRS